MSGITFADGNFTYDREAHSIAISGTLPAGVSVSYDVGYKVNAGEYTVTATFTGDSANYNAIPDMTAKLTIAKAAYDMSGITFENGSVTYDGEAHSLAISGTLPDGVTVTYEDNDKVNAGTYTVTAKFAGDYDNYEVIARYDGGAYNRQGNARIYYARKPHDLRRAHACRRNSSRRLDLGRRHSLGR